MIYMISMCRVQSLITGVYHQYINQPFLLMGQLAFDRLLLLSHDADGVIGEDETFHINKGPKEPAYFLLHWIESMDLILP